LTTLKASELQDELRRRSLMLLAVSQFRANPEVLVVSPRQRWEVAGMARRLIEHVPESRECADPGHRAGTGEAKRVADLSSCVRVTRHAGRLR
jgi:hypothetical protein